MDDIKIDLTPYAGQTKRITVEVVVPGGGQVEPPAEEVEDIGHFDFGKSDVYHGQFYFLIEGSHSSLTIGGVPYRFDKIYHDGRELWYGTGEGEIKLTGKNGTIFVGRTGEFAPSGNRYDLDYKGLSNGNRPTYYTNNGKRLVVGNKVSLKVGNLSKSFTAKVRPNGSIGYDWPDGTVVKNSEISARGVAVLTPAGSGQHSGWILW